VLPSTGATALPCMEQSLARDTKEQKPGLMVTLFQRKCVKHPNAATPSGGQSVADFPDETAPGLAPIILKAPEHQSNQGQEKYVFNEENEHESVLLFGLFQTEGAIVEVNAKEVDHTNAIRNKRDVKELEETPVERPRRRSSSFIAMFFDASRSTDDNRTNEDRVQVLIEYDSIKSSDSEQPLGAQEKDLNETIQEVKFKVEDMSLEFERDTNSINVSMPIDDPYLDENDIDQEEQICCSFLFR
jgi:hypothetical protein